MLSCRGRDMGKIIITDDNGEDRKYLHQMVQKYNQKYFEKAEFQDISVCLKSESGEIQAGLAGTVRGRWFLIWELWVKEELRRKKLGSEILKKAEEEARKRGCQYALLDTFEFQAPEFYKRKGYREVFVYMEHEITGNHYYLSKKLLKE